MKLVAMRTQQPANFQIFNMTALFPADPLAGISIP